MSAGSDRANDFLDAVYGSGHASHIPGTVYLTVYHVAPTDDGGGTEASYDTFARVALTNNDTNFPAAADREQPLAVEVSLPTPGEATDDFEAWALHGHVTNDDIMDWAYFPEPIPGAEAGQPIKIDAGDLIITLVPAA